MALHLAFPALRSMAPLSYDILFLFPPHPNLSRVCIVISSGRSRQFFPTFIYRRRVGQIAVNRPQMKRLASLGEHAQCHHFIQKPSFSPVHTQVRSKRFHKSPDFETVRFLFPKTPCGRNTLGRLKHGEKKTLCFKKYISGYGWTGT